MFAATEYFTWPGPFPDAPLDIEIQLTDEFADQAQPDGARTSTLPLPPFGGIESVVCDSDTEQPGAGVGVGAGAGEGGGAGEGCEGGAGVVEAAASCDTVNV